jgi:hypothetical protein
MATTESYIRSHQEDVDKWIIKLSGEYIKKLLETDKHEAHYVNSSKVCNDARRIEKVLEVLRYYDLIEKSRYNSGSRHYGYSSRYDKDSYDILVNHSSFKKVAKKFGKKFNFKIEAPDESKDRVKGYPTIQNISSEGLIHYYFHQEQYELFDREEVTRSRYSSREERTRRIRLYPKSLESRAERAVFEKAMNRYYKYHLDEAIKLLYGFEPKAIKSERKITDDPIKDLYVHGTNQLNLNEINKEKVKEYLEYAKDLQAYADACVRDLEKLATEVPKDNNNLIKKLHKLGEADLMMKAPMLISSEDERARDVATLLLKGSNKGLI